MSACVLHCGTFYKSSLTLPSVGARERCAYVGSGERRDMVAVHEGSACDGLRAHSLRIARGVW